MIMSTYRTLSMAAAAGILFVGSAAPALAMGHVSANARTADGGTMRHDATTGKYCVSDTFTGSRIPHVECKTQEEWAAAGLHISSK